MRGGFCQLLPGYSQPEYFFSTWWSFRLAPSGVYRSSQAFQRGCFLCGNGALCLRNASAADPREARVASFVRSSARISVPSLFFGFFLSLALQSVVESSSGGVNEFFLFGYVNKSTWQDEKLALTGRTIKKVTRYYTMKR